MRRHAIALLFLPLISVLAAPAAASSPGRALGPVGDPPPVPRRLVLNEVDYDQPGWDTGEFVEIVNTGGRRVRLRTVDLILVNGATATEYRRVPLVGRLGPSRRLVVAGSAVVPPDGGRTLPLPLARDNVQNGSPDAIALFDHVHGVLIDAISYEGDVTAAIFDDVPGIWPLVAGTAVSESDGNETAGSICRLPDRGNSGDDDADWGACSPTPGEPNAG